MSRLPLVVIAALLLSNWAWAGSTKHKPSPASHPAPASKAAAHPRGPSQHRGHSAQKAHAGRAKPAPHARLAKGKPSKAHPAKAQHRAKKLGFGAKSQARAVHPKRPRHATAHQRIARAGAKSKPNGAKAKPNAVSRKR